MRSSVFVVFIFWLAFAHGGGNQEHQNCGNCVSDTKIFSDIFVQWEKVADSNAILTKKIRLLERQLKEKDEQIKQLIEQNKSNFKERDETTINCSAEFISKMLEIEAKIKHQETAIKHCQGQLTIKESSESPISQSPKRDSRFQSELPRGQTEVSSCSNDVHTIRLRGHDPFDVPCNASVSGSGWSVIQRRVNGHEDFNRNWSDYKKGFGNLREDFFLGLEKVHLMTLTQPHELYIQLGKVNGETSFARYDNFQIGSEAEGYKLKSLGKYSGTAGDSLTKDHLNRKFSTWDHNDDNEENYNCAKYFAGGWWFSDCGESSLNGKYYTSGKGPFFDGIQWGSWHNYDFYTSLSFTQMMIRPKGP